MTELAGKDAQYLNCNQLMSILWTVLSKHTPAGCLVLLNMELIGSPWYNFSPTFPRPRHVNSPLKIKIHYFGGKYFYLNMFKEMPESFILHIIIFLCISYLISNTVGSICIHVNACPPGTGFFKRFLCRYQKDIVLGLCTQRVGKLCGLPTCSGLSPSCGQCPVLD